MFFVNLLFFTIISNPTAEGIEKEFCNSDVFLPRCQDTDEVIVINEAHFGRKKIGKCLKDEETLDGINVEDKRFLGCYSDVKPLISRKCSGKSFCEVRVAELPPPKPCFNFLRYYLGVSFKCIRIIQDNRQCSLNLINAEPHYLLIKPGIKCGSIGYPWLIEALTGQKIGATLMDFSKSDEHLELFRSQSKQCSVQLGYIYDKFSYSNKSICISNVGNSSALFKYQSMSNILEVGFQSDMIKDSFELPVIKFIVSGCSDLIPPSDAWLKRTDNEATIGCYSNRLRWKLKCVGQRWIGVIGNCSYGHVLLMVDRPEGKLSPEADSNQSVVMIAIGMSGTVVSFLIACIGMICIKRYQLISKAKSGRPKMTNPLYDDESLPSHANKITHGDLQEKCGEVRGCGSCPIFLNDSQKYYELDQALFNKDKEEYNFSIS